MGIPPEIVMKWTGKKTPRKEIETAARIMKEYFNNKKKLEDHG